MQAEIINLLEYITGECQDCDSEFYLDELNSDKRCARCEQWHEEQEPDDIPF